MPHYISDSIGDDYKSWKRGDSIIIASPTGSGKTTFILSKLLPLAIEQGQHIVYFCNRKILQEQFSIDSAKSLEEFFPEGHAFSIESLPFIHIVTYQYCEQTSQYTEFCIEPDLPKMSRQKRVELEMCGALPKPVELSKTQIMYYVFDEAHYFVADATFNPNTNYWLPQDFSHGISIYLTATPDPLLRFYHVRKIQHGCPLKRSPHS